jgi:outer membrane cobalamin receptor
MLMLAPRVLLCQQQDAKPEPVKTSITVIEKIDAEAPANIGVLNQYEIEQTPGVNLDDRLRDIPGFSLFRRSSSLVAHPTTQGISLRGIGSSGASRTLVLLDGIPVNDPFGGWVYWTRFDPEELARVEVSRGASTSIFGDRAMGGVIGLFTREPERHRLSASYEGGNENTHQASLGYSNLWDHWAISGDGRAFTTDGYFIVPDTVRGAVDRPAGVRFVGGAARLDYFQRESALFIRADILAEDRKNGTVLQNNSTGLGMAALNYNRQFRNNTLSLLAYHTREEFRSTFSAIAANRNSETLTYRQTVPSEATGGAALWQHRRSRWNVLGGGDIQHVEGYSTDTFPVITRVGGGKVLQHGVFAQSDVAVGPARFFLGARHSVTGQDSSFFSPSGGAVLGRGPFRARASLYRSFRAPTLNELFREFRVGNTVTQANSALRPESLFGVEVGADWIGEALNLRVTGYRNSIDDLITNVTLASAPNMIIRQRRNASQVLSRGFEAEADRTWRHWRGEAAYLFVDSRFSTGERVPQIPRHQGSARVVYQRGGTFGAVGLRSYASQFEDELNRFLLPGYATIQLVMRQRLVAGLWASLAMENLLNRGYLVGFSPTPTIGGPRLWRAGLRWEGRVR